MLNKYFTTKQPKKINEAQKNAKAYWSLVKMFLNNKEIPLVNRFITDFKVKPELLNLFFSKQCSLISNDSSRATSIILLKNAYRQSICQSRKLVKLFKILILIKYKFMTT